MDRDKRSWLFLLEKLLIDYKTVIDLFPKHQLIYKSFEL